MMIDIPLATAERIVTSEPWYVTAGVALAAALFGSVVGVVSTYQMNVRQDKRHRVERAEIRRKAKVYTPIRAELLALRNDIAQDKHLSSGILRADRGYRTQENPPELYVWRGFVEDGRALSSASERVRKALDDLDEQADTFNTALSDATAIFQERADAMFESLGIKPPWPNWVQSGSGFPFLVRHRFDQMFSGPLDNELKGEVLQAFTEAWNHDSQISAVSQSFAGTEAALRKSLVDAIDDVETAMQRIAQKHEHEPED
jgi:hypothetical protein